MATAKNAVIYLEQGATLQDFTIMTDSGDHQCFTCAADVFSGKSGQEPVVRPNGIVSGRNLVTAAASGAADAVDVAAFTAYSKGTLHSVAAATDLTITRPATDVAKVCSITMDETGALAVIAGTDGADTTFSETRGAAGGPPEIPADSVEIAQVRVTSSIAAPIAASEIYQIVGQHTERADFPVYSVNNIGKGQAADVAAETNAHVKFASALPATHTGGAAKRVYIRYYEPIFAELPKALDFTPAETTHSVSSTEYYNGTIGSRSSSLGQGQFTALLDDGITDALVADKDEVLTVKFLPDRNKTAYSLTQGAIGISRSFPVSDQIKATVTISAEVATAEFAG